jgi:DNA repair exonuclease SbcCD ATPase subunit
MAFAGLIFIGFLFGVLLSGIVIGFIVVRSGGPLKESLFGDAAGKMPFGSPPPARPAAIDADNRCKALLEDLRVANKLLDQDRVLREQNARAAKDAAAEIDVLRNQVAERQSQIGLLETSLREAGTRIDDLMSQLSDRTEELSTVSLELKDARTQLDVSESGETVTSIQISQLQRERDELAALVDRLRPRPVAGRPFA